MMSLRMLATRLPVSSLSSAASRSLSSQTSQSIEKLRNVLEEYRQNYYTQELPMRFKKDVVKAARISGNTDRVAVDGMQRVLANLGVQHHFTPAEMQSIFAEIGNEVGEVPTEHMVKIL